MLYNSDMIEGSNEYHDRLQKLKLIEEAGGQGYPERFEVNAKARDALAAGEKGELREVKEIVDDEVKNDFQLAGRMLTFRQHGKLSFAHLQDFSGKLQICFMEDILGKEVYKTLRRLDMADHLGVHGELFRTNHGEVTLMVKEFVLLSKALRPLPEKWHGIKDKEIMYRQRYLETTTNRETMERFIFRSNLIRALREFYWSEDFIELETPVLETVSSGATALPFVTKHNALDMDVYLRIAGESCGKRWL